MSFRKTISRLAESLQNLFFAFSNPFKQVPATSQRLITLTFAAIYFVLNLMSLSEKYRDCFWKRNSFSSICILLASVAKPSTEGNKLKAQPQSLGLSLLNLLYLVNEIYFLLEFRELDLLQEDKNQLLIEFVFETSWKIFMLNRLSTPNIIKLCHVLLHGYIISLVVIPNHWLIWSVKILGQGLLLGYVSSLRANEKSIPSAVLPRPFPRSNSANGLQNLEKVIDYFSEGVALFNLQGQTKFVNKHFKSLLDVGDDVTMDQLNEMIVDLKFLKRETKLETLTESEKSIQNLIGPTERKNLTCLWDIFSLLIKEYDFAESYFRSCKTMEASFRHRHTHEWHKVELKPRLLLDNNNEKLFLLFLKDQSELEQKTLSIQKEKWIYQDNLIASFSHELRTPLNANLGFLEQSMESSIISKEAKENFIKPAFVSGKLLYFMVSDILDYSLILAQGLRLDLKSMNLYETLKSCVELVQPKYTQKNIRLQISIDKDVSDKITTDHQRLMQIMINLLNNALQFTIQGEVTIHVARTSKDRLLLSVKDSGIGIDQDGQRKLEKNLSRDYLEDKANSGMMTIGLGLFIANKLVMALNWEQKQGIKFISSVNRGSIFYFEIKDHPSTQNEHKHFQYSPRGLGTMENEQFNNLNTKIRQYQTRELKNSFSFGLERMSMNFHRPQLLVVDDEIFNLIVMENYCKMFGVSSVKALNGLEAIERLKNDAKAGESSIKIVVMDINMPVMDGYDATKEIQRMIDKGVIHDVTVVGLTAYISWEKIEKGYQSGMTEVLNKPISKEMVSTLLKKYNVL